MVPRIRRFSRNEAPVRADRDYVLYWMIAARRVRSNFAVDRAVELARELGKPLLVFEPLRADYPWASERFHRFVIQGMRDNAEALDGTGIGYHPYVEPEVAAGRGLLAALARRAAAIVTDEYPCSFLPRMTRAAAQRLDVHLEAVDSNGLLPLAAADRAFHRAFDFRRFLQRELPGHLGDRPRGRLPGTGELPVFQGVPSGIRQRWPANLEAPTFASAVPPVGERGGAREAERALERFVGRRLARYGEERNQPDDDAASGLSAYLHFGHLSAHQVLDAVAERESWTPWRLADRASGRRNGWWGMSDSAESFLDEAVTWRELGYGFSFHRSDYAEYESLPAWALATLREHASDERPYLYTLEELEEASTHDELWNAAQRELRERGRIHNYLRMLWGKKILHWTRSPREALEVMIELNNKYAIDGRDPNSYSGIFWVLGRFDRAWGPERSVFGKVRYMSSRNTRRKLRLDGYLERWGRQREIAG